MPKDIETESIEQKLSEQAHKAPRSAGVYLMYSAENEVIYIGKAKSLRNRLLQYINRSDERSQIEFLMRRVTQIDVVMTDTEEQAFILERDLINKHKPRYNIRLKDDKAYLSIRIDENAEWPRLELVRRVEQDGASYYGPYSFSYEVRELLDLIGRVIPLRSCSNTVFYNRVRPCLEYQIKRCAGPCCLKVDPAEYRHWVKQAKAILEGKTEALVKELNRSMELASQDLRFEDAAVFRDRLNMLDGFKQGQKYLSASADDKDAWALFREESLAVVSLLRFRRGRVAGVQNYAFKDVRVDDAELLEAVLEQHYKAGAEFVPEIILPQEPTSPEFIRRRLKELAGFAVEIHAPERGLKYRLLKLAELNATQHYTANFNSEQRSQELSKSLAKLCALNQMPRRVECIDISNLQGSDIVGAVVSFYEGRPDKQNYKRYRISFSGEGEPNDFAAVHEVVTRRLKRGVEEDSLPDLLVIDGGPGQLSAALNARDALAVNLDIISIAKERDATSAVGSRAKRAAKEERIYLQPFRESAIILDPDSAAGRFLIQLRDETHRFVITFHRERRSKRVISSALDSIPGIGPDRSRRLLKHFGSTANIASADIEDIARAGRMGRLLAQKLKAALQA